MKITDAAYTLPTVMPAGIVGELTRGANCPLHIQGFCKESGVTEDYVVKLKDSERMGDPAAAMRELLGAFVCAELEIPVVEPVIVEVTPQTAELTHNPNLKQRIGNSAGLNFGTRHLGTGYMVVRLLAPLPPNLEQQGANLVGFDLLTQHPDRTYEKPNMLTNGTRLVALDHELAFSFVHVLFGPVTLWELQQQDKAWIDNLVLKPKVNWKKYDFDAFEAQMQQLDEAFWNRAQALIPAPWRHHSLEKIRDSMLDFIANKSRFTAAFQKIVS